MPSAESNPLEGIAIIGMSGRFPGARNVDQFWKNLAAGVESIARFSEEETEFSVASAEEKAQGRRVVRARGILADVDKFDAAFFGIYPREAELMDPQHRFFLECAWEAIESAGYDPEAYPGLIGVYAGLSLNSYLLNNLIRDRAFAANFAGNYQIGEYPLMMGNDKDFMPTRVSYKLNLRGPSMSIQAACSTSLVAVSQACTSLLNYQCDMALAGGVSISFPQKRDYFYEEDGMASVDGTCRTFDAEAKGTVFGHGTAVVLLKRLADAVADGDHVLAVIKGTAVNNDGSEKIGYAAPSVNAQADVIAMAQAAAGVSPDSISYIEAHGTGTPLGDPIEVAALTKAFRAGGSTGNGFCALGTGKTNISHLDVAAGATGLIKLVLQLQHEAIPPLLHFKAPNPQIDFANSPFFPVTKLTDWKRGKTPRRAGVSAFGVGGTNAHAVVEEAPLASPSGPSRKQQLLVLSARTETALQTMTANLVTALEAQPEMNLADVAFTLKKGRRAFAHRRIVVAADTTEAVAKLKAIEPKFVFTEHTAKGESAVVFLFPGQGAQHVDMGRELYETEPAFRAEVDRCAEILERHLNVDIRTILYPEGVSKEAAQKQIGETSITQPAMFVVEYALARLWMSWGIKPSVLIGHSIGEYVCAVLAETFTLEDALALLAARARLMQQLPSGSMLAVRLPANEVEPLLPAGASVAAINSAKTCTVSGPTPVLENFLGELTAKKIAARMLPTSHAFHSAMMDPMLPDFSAAAAKTPRQAPKIPWISTCTGHWMSPEDIADAGYWSRQLRQPVRFTEALDTLFKEPRSVLLEVGPGQTLSQLIRQHPAKPAACAVLTTLGPEGETDRDLSSVLTALGRLWIAGVKPDWDAFYAQQSRRRVPLPTYPFERQRFWVEPVKAEAIAASEKIAAVPVEIAGKTPFTSPAEGAPVGAAVAVTRRERLVVQLRNAIKDLSGLEVAHDKTTFMEMGFDSLFLTQASQEFQRQYGIKVTFRQLINELSTVSDLARHLDEKLPPESPSVASAVARSTGTPALESVTTPPPSIAAVPGGLQNNAFGPSAVSNRATEIELTPQQKRHLEGLIDRYTRRTKRSKELTQKYRQWHADPRTASGFNRQWKEMCYQIVVEKSSGSHLRDVDGNDYIDLLNGFGPNFLGHSPAFVTEALKAQLDRGIEVGPQSPVAGEAASLFCELTGNDRASFVNTGSEAVYAAMRLARTVTGKDKIVVFNRDYHGNFDEVLVRGLGAVADFRTVPSAPGIPRRAVQDMYVLDYGSDEALAFIEKHAGEIAAVLVEPVQSRRPEFQPYAFVKAVRQLTEQKGMLLIFDEVITGFRDGLHGAQAIFGVKADIATYGKVVGGGMPIGVVSGKAQYMDTFDGGMWRYGDDSFPEKGVTFFAGTFVRHPMAMAAVLAVLKYLKAQEPSFWEKINAKAKRLATTVDSFFVEKGIPMRMPHFCSQMYVRVQEDQKYGNLLFFHLREKGIFLLESFPCYMTAAHTDQEVDRVIETFKESALQLQEAGFFSPPSDKSVSIPKTVAALKPETVALPVAMTPLDAPHIAPTGAFSDMAAATDRFPLAEGQREMWLGAQMSPEAAGPHHACTVIDFKGAFDLAAMRRAIDAVIQRHEGLRCVFNEDGTEVIVRPTLNLELPLDDLSGLRPAEQKEAAEQIVNKEGRQIFNLTDGPLFACRIIRLSPTHHQLIFTAQMIACDGWSHYVVFEEMSAYYSAYVEGRELKLPPAIPMRDYALWQEKHRDDADARACQTFWRSKYKEVPASLDLPTLGLRPPNRTVTADRRELTFPPEFYSAIKTLAKDQKNSSFALLLAAFQTWLYRLSGATDLVVGVPFSAQGPLGFDLLVGQCANTLPLRAHLEPTEPFTALLQRTWADLLDAQENWNYTFGKLAQQLDLPRDPSRIPLVSVLFNIDPPMSKVGFARLKHRFITGPRFYYQYDLGFNLVEDEGSLRVECDYNRNLFDGATIQAWLASYEALLRRLITSPTQSLAKLPMVAGPAATAQAALTEENLPGEERLTVHGMIQAQMDRTPDALAAVDENSRLTYAELNQKAELLANHLTALGVEKNSLVGLCLDRNADMLVAILGVHRIGAAYVPLSPELPSERKAQVLTDAGATVVLTHAKLLEVLPSTAAKPVCLDRDWATIQAAKGSRPAVTPLPDSLAYLIYTSGSTGAPKGVELPHRAVVNFLISMQREPGLRSDDAVLALSPLSFDISVLELLLPLTVGARTVIASRATATDPAALGELIATSGVTVVQATPSTWRMLLNAGWKGGKGLRLLTGGEALTPDLANQLLATGGEVWNMYGPTETTVWSTIARVHSAAALSIGEPIRNTTVHIIDDLDQPAPISVPGELLIGGRGLARGYHNLPELTAAKFITNESGNRLYRTGDRVRRRADGSIEYIGRRDLQVKVRGCLVELGDIESVIRQHVAVDDAAVELRNDVAGGSGLVAYVTRTPQSLGDNVGLTDNALIRELRQLVRDRLPDYMRPARWMVLAKMPQSSTGKLERSALPPPPATVHDLSDDYAAPETKTQEILAGIWQKTLRIDRVGIRDSFFDLGGQSLLAVTLFSLIEKEFKRKLPLSTLFRAPTIEQLAAVITGGDPSEGDWSCLVPIQPKGTLTPLFLVHGAGGNVLLYRTLAGYLSPGRPLYGLQSRGLDGKSEPLKTIEAMAERYLADIRAVQPHGPYLLGGYCLGGTIAYDMALRLRQAGEEVALVAMLDTYNFSRALKVSFASFILQKLKFHGANFVRLSPREMWSYLGEKVRLARDGELANILTAKPNPMQDDGVARATTGPEATVQAINDNAADVYLPKYYDGRLTLFKPEANYKFYPDPNMGWSDLVGGLDIVELPFKPHAMLMEPYVKILAKTLNQSMDRVKTKQPATDKVEVEPLSRI